MAKLTRTAPVAVVALVLALAAAAPAAAAQPVMDRFESNPSDLAAGQACAFPIERDALPGGFDMTREYSDGRFVFSAHVDILLTNPANGKTFVHKAKFNGIDRYDPSTGIDIGVTSGQVLMQFLPGDMGPYGIVGSNGALFRFVGSSWYTWSDTAGALIDFGYKGTVTDVCALLS
jgi:hypothetical protein